MKCNETIGKWCKNKHGASKIIDTFETYHQLNFTAQVQAWGETLVQQREESMARANSRRAWPEQAPSELGQRKLQVGMARAEQSPGEHRASSRRAQRRSEVEGTLTRRPGDTTVAWRGSAHAATMASSQGKSPTTCRRIT
jgi:hypothetical protein